MLMILLSLHVIQILEFCNVIRLLEDDCSVFVKWFFDNLSKLNDEKCHLIIFGNKSANTTIKKMHTQKLNRVTMKNYREQPSTRN